MNIVKELRKKAGIQQKELAIIIGVSRPTVSEWESGKKDPSGERLKKLAEYFGVDQLKILGKGMVDLSQLHDITPRTVETRIVSANMDDLPKVDREVILSVFMAMMRKNFPERFEKGEINEA